MEQELPTLPEHLSSIPVFSGVRIALLFGGFLGTVLSDLFQCTSSDYFFVIFKLFCLQKLCELNYDRLTKQIFLYTVYMI